MSNTQNTSLSKQRVFSGTRATGRLHLGNYLGAIKGYLELTAQDQYDCIFMVMDLHAITTPYDHHTLAQATKDIILDYLAAGLDPQKAIVTTQSLVPEHAYLSFLLSTQINVARLQHLPTYKEKVAQHPNDVTLALLSYPVLMAADILLYQASLVPVGIDQEPHLEIAREIVRKLNDRFQTHFPEPMRYATTGEYVPSLKGEGKMSKSVEGSYINLTDDLVEIEQKLKVAPTDSGKGTIVDSKVDSNLPRTSVATRYQFLDQHTSQPSLGVANLLTLVELFEGESNRQYYHELYQGAGIRYGDLKKELAVSIFAELAPIQERRAQLVRQDQELIEIVHDGANKASQIAKHTIIELKEKMGLML